MNRAELRGEKLNPKCYRAHTITEFNGDVICYGLYGDGRTERGDIICGMCSKCGAYEANWNDDYHTKRMAYEAKLKGVK